MTDLRTRPEPAELDLDAEQEVDVRRYWSRIVSRWWLPVAGLAVGVAAGLVLAAGGSKVYRAETTLYLGQPFNPSGNAPVQSLATNPTTVGQFVRSEFALKEAAATSRMPLRRLRGNVSTKTVSPAVARRTAVGQTQLVEVSVQGRAPLQAERAADALAASVVERVSGYVDVKITAFRRQLQAQDRQLASLERRITALNAAVRRAAGLSPVEQLVLISQLDNAEQRRGQVEEDRLETQQFLSLAENVERPSIFQPAAARETSARSPRNSAIVGGLIGLLLGALAALLWDPVEPRFRRVTS